MKWKSIAAALGAMLLASTVFAQGETFVHGQAPYAKDRPHVGTFVGGMYSADSTGFIFGVDANGYIYVNDSSRDRDNVVTFQNVIASDSLRGSSATIGADSSAVLDVHDLRHLKLLVDATPLGSSTLPIGYSVRLAFQFREMLNGAADSASVFADYQVREVLATSAQAVVTVNAGHLVSGSATAPWSGEFVVSISVTRSAGAGAGSTFYYPHGVSILLDRIFGSDAWWNKLQIRVRPLNPLPAVKVRCHLVGVSL